MKRSLLGSLAAFRTPAKPWDTRSPLCAGGVQVGLTFSFWGLGQSFGPLKTDLDAVAQRLNRPDYAPVTESLREIGVYSLLDLFSGYAGQKSDLASWLEGAELNRDGDLRLQYLAGWGINSSLEDFIYRRMASFRQLPRNIFTGSPEHVQNVLNAIAGGEYPR